MKRTQITNISIFHAAAMTGYSSYAALGLLKENMASTAKKVAEHKVGPRSCGDPHASYR